MANRTSGSDATPPEPVKRRSTIDDVARASGVSRQTVSNVVRGRGRLGDETRRRVRRAIDRLEYMPHPGASSLRSGRTMQLAHPMPAIELDRGNAIAIEFIQALVAAAGEHGRHVVLTASGDDAQAVTELIASRRVDGFLFSDLQPRDRRVALVVEHGIPFACFGRTEPDLPQCWVDVDNEGGIGTAVRHLVAKGHTEIAYLGYQGDAYWDFERRDGYLGAMAAADLPRRPFLCANSPARIASAVAALMAGPRLPTAVVTGSDALAAAIYAAAERRGVTIGRDLDVTGFDGSVIGRNLLPRLTTLAIPIGDIAHLVVERVLRELEQSTNEPGQLIPLTLTHGESA